jgi:hypothetical protein
MTPCTDPSHEITRMFGEAKDGAVTVTCICWTCQESGTVPVAWTELWRLEKVVGE